MVELVQIKSGGREKDIQPLFSAYAEWLAVNIQRENGITLDSAELLHSFMEGIDKFYPPKGRLDSPKFAPSSHGLYRSRGFQPIQRYPGSELEEEYAHLVVYMQLILRDAHETK